MGDTGTDRHPVAATRQDDPAAAPLDQFRATADDDAKRHQAAPQALAAIDPDEAQVLPHRHLAERYQFVHPALLLIMIRIAVMLLPY